MKNLQILGLVFALLIGGYTYKKYRVAPSILFPEIDVINTGKEITKLPNTNGKVRIVSFYASWCPDCKREFPKMLSASNSDLSDAEFFAITDEGYDKMMSFKQSSGYPFQFYTLPSSFDEYKIFAIPTTYILNSKNEIIYSKVGEIDWQNEKFLSEIKK